MKSKKTVLYLVLSCVTGITLQAQNELTPEQKQAKAQFRETINKYNDSDLETLPESDRDTYIIAKAKMTLFPNSLNYTMSDIKKSKYNGVFEKYENEPVFILTFYKDIEKKKPSHTVYVLQNIDRVFVTVYEKESHFD